MDCHIWFLSLGCILPVQNIQRYFLDGQQGLLLKNLLVKQTPKLEAVLIRWRFPIAGPSWSHVNHDNKGI